MSIYTKFVSSLIAAIIIVIGTIKKEKERKSLFLCVVVSFNRH